MDRFVAGKSAKTWEVWFAAKIIELNGGFSSKQCLITKGN